MENEKDPKRLKAVEQMLKAQAGKAEAKADSLLTKLVTSNWTLAILALGAVILLWLVFR